MNKSNILKHCLALALVVLSLPTMAQRFVDKIDRGLVAVPSESTGNFISWRVLGEEQEKSEEVTQWSNSRISIQDC